MKLFAHRGVIDYENTIRGVLEVMQTSMTLGVEIDVRYNTAREVVMCHDRENRNDTNDTLTELLIELEKESFMNRDLMIDIKAFGIINAKKIANDVCKIVAKHPTLLRMMNIYLCSFNEYCVSDLLFCKEDLNLTTVYIGVITSGIPLGLFEHLTGIQFVSIEYSTLCEEIMEQFKDTNLEVYTWVVNDITMQQLMCKYKVDGLIYDVITKK
tara:strand:- start:3804 stop:4439 length:636 start_codon:yes stop_codon:yes gene_type:complete